MNIGSELKKKPEAEKTAEELKVSSDAAVELTDGDIEKVTGGKLIYHEYNDNNPDRN